MQSKSRLNGLMVLSCLVILLLTPFFLVPNIHNFLTLGKIALLKIGGAFTILMMMIFLPKLKITWRPSSFLYPLIIFVAAILGSVFFGHDCWVALVGGFERTFGFIGYLLLALLFIYLNFQEVSEAQIKSLVKVTYYSGFFMALYAVLQFIGWDFFPFIPPFRSAPLSWENFSSAHPGSFTGNSGYISCYLAFIFPLSIPLYFSSKIGTQKSKILFCNVIILLALLFARTRSVWFSLIASFLVFFIFYFETKFKTERLKKILWALLPVLFVIFLFFILKRYDLKFLESGFIDSLTARFNLIVPSLKLIFHYPAFGIGSENYRPAMMPFSPLELAKNPKVFFDNPHNNYLSIWVQFGIVALVMHFLILYRWLKLAKRIYQTKEWKFYGAALIISGWSCFFWQWSWFDTIVSLPLWILTLLILSFIEQKIPGVDVYHFERKFNIPKWFELFLRSAIGLTCLFSIYITTQMLAANAKFFSLAASLSESSEGKTNRLNELIDELNQTHELYPYESRYLVELSRVHGRRFLLNKEPRELEKALEISKLSEAHAWENDKIYIFQMRVLLELNRMSEAIEVGEKAVKFSPNNVELRLKMAQMYLERGRGESALAHLLFILKVNENDLGAFELLAKYYISKKDKISATLYTQKILQHYPNLMNGLVQELFKQINNIP